MANADGSVIFSCDLDSTKAQKKLSKLRDKISELNSELEKETGNKLNLEKQLDAASQAAKATEERVKALRKEVERLNDREWIQKQGFTQSEYQAQVLDRRAAAEAELKQQEELLHTQTKEVKTLSAAYEETTANIDSMTVKLDKAKVAAGELIANTEQERREREAENSALAKAGQYAARFRDQVKSLARSMLVFSVITAALMALRKQIKAAIATSAEASDAFARLKGALLTLAAPLMDVLIPALTWLMNLLAAIVSEIVTIISILSGKSKKSMEASGKNLYKEAAAIDATGKAAKEATDALAAFDEINKLSTTTSVGGGGGGASAIAPDFDFDFDEGPMMEKLDKVFQKINDIFKTIRAGLEIVVDDLKWSFDKKAIPKSKATWLTVLTALLGATLGAAFGGITGGVIGLSLGVLLGLYLVGLDPETWKTEMDAEDAWIVVITALLGALLGSVFLGITGGVAGFSLGAILGLYLTGFAEGDEEHGGKSQLLSELIVVLCALLGAVIGSIVTPGVGTVVGMGLGLILGLSIYSVRKDPKKGTQRLVSIGRSVLLGLLAGVLGVGLAALGIVSAGTAFIISAAIGLALNFFVDSVDDSKVRKATSGFTGTRVSTSRSTRGVAAQSLNSAAPVYNEIPALASGAVIPPNRKFLAVLGDQKSGTNVEAPLSTIKQAVMEALAQGDREPINVNLVVDGKTLARVVVPNINNMTRAAGKPVLLY